MSVQTRPSACHPRKGDMIPTLQLGNGFGSSSAGAESKSRTAAMDVDGMAAGRRTEDLLAIKRQQEILHRLSQEMHRLNRGRTVEAELA